MQLETFSGTMISTEVTKSYTDFQDASTSKSANIITLPANSAIIGIEVDISNGFGIDNNNCLLSMDNDLVLNKNISTPKTMNINEYKDLQNEPILLTTSTIIQATVKSDGIAGWSMSGDLPFSNRYGQCGAGTQTAAICTGGYGNSSYWQATGEYNGTSWTSGGTLSGARSHAAATGTINSALVTGGDNSGYLVSSEEYNGTSWTAGGNLSVGRFNLECCGTQDAALAFGGWTGSNSNVSEEYNGTSWTSGNSLITARNGIAGCGTQTAGLSFGGKTTIGVALTEEYDGNIWTTANNLNIISWLGGGVGTQSSGLSFSGQDGNENFTLRTEMYDGTNWIIGNIPNKYRDRFGEAGDQSHAAQFGGHDGTSNFPPTTENWDKSDPINLSNLYSGSLTFKIRYINYNE